MYLKTDALTVCNTILKKAFDENIEVTPMKLQRLLYLVYRDYLHFTNEALFPERFEPWKYGPAIQKVHDVFKQYDDKPIPKMYARNDRNCYMLDIYKMWSGDDFRLAFDGVWKKYKHYSGVELSKFIQELDMAWKDSWKAKKQFIADFDIRNEFLWDIDVPKTSKNSLNNQINKAEQKKIICHAEKQKCFDKDR